jgi:hypothetical protein
MKHIITTLLLLCALQLFAQKNTEPYTISRFAEAKITNVKAETSGGNISIVGETAGSPRVEVFIEAGNNRKENQLTKEEIRQRLESDYEFKVSVTGGTLSAIAKPKRNDRNWDWRRQLSISFKIFVPKNISSDLATSGGNIDLSDLNGTQEFRTSGGNLVLNTLSGKLDGRTSGGNIVIKNSKDDIDLATSGGNVTAENCSGRLDLSTSGGNLHLSGLKGNIHATTSGGGVRADHVSGDLLAHTSGGSITLKEIDGGIDAATSGGNIDVSLSSVTKNVKLSNSGGNIYLQLPKNKGMDLRLTGESIRAETIANFKGVQDKEKIEGSVNGGGASVRVNANSGTIRLVMQ